MKIFVFGVELLQIVAIAFLALIYLIANHYVKKIERFATDEVSKGSIHKYIGVTYLVAFTYILVFIALVIRFVVSGLYDWVDLSSAIAARLLLYIVKIELLIIMVRYTTEVRLMTKLIGDGNVVILGLDSMDREMLRLVVSSN